MTTELFEELAFRPLQAEDVPEATTILSQSFCRYDPLEIALGISELEFSNMLSYEMPVIVNEKRSIIARLHDQDRSMQSVCIANDALSDPVDSLSMISEKFKPISAMVGELHDAYLKGKKLSRGDILYFFMLGVNPHYQGKGIGKHMISQTLLHAQSLGYKKAFAITTSLVSTHILVSNGFRVLKTLDYATYQYEGACVFKNIPTDPGLALMEWEI